MKTAATLLAGGGPAGLGVLLAARRAGLLEPLLKAGLALVERGPSLGSGELGRYAIRSDSHAESFTASPAAEAWPPLDEVWRRPPGAAMRAAAGAPVPLALAAAFLDDVGEAMQRWLDDQDGASMLFGTRVVCARRLPDGGWETECLGPDGHARTVRSRTLVIAAGAQETADAWSEFAVAGEPLLPRHGGRLLLSGDVLRAGEEPAALARLDALASPRIVIVGGSHSALSCARRLLERPGAARLGEGAITLLHHQPLRLTYDCAAAALADGFHGFGPADICPASRRVFRLAGFRADSRELARQVLGLGGLAPERRVRLLRIDEAGNAAAQAALDAADLVIGALGYRPRALPMLDVAGEPIVPFSATGWGRPLVDGRSRVLDARGEVVPGAFALGLSAGYPLAGQHGEPSFRGQANGLALWHSSIGEEVVRQVLAAERITERAGHVPA